MTSPADRKEESRVNAIIDKLILAGILSLITASIGSSVVLANLSAKFDTLTVTISGIPSIKNRQTQLEERQIELYRRQDQDDVLHAQILQRLSEKQNAHR